MTRYGVEDIISRRVRRIAISLVVLLVLMFIPAVFYSLNTPFALVDDLNDSVSVSLLSSSKAFHFWLNATFVGVSDGGRYRPLFDLHNAVAWLAIGPHPVGHHLVRWGEWLAGILFWNMALWRMVRTRYYGVAPRAQNTMALMPMLIFNVFVCFFPNQPVARLAPQELQTFGALGLLFLGAMRLLTDPENAGKTTIAIRTLMIALGYVGLSMAKETNVALMAMFCLFLFGISFVRRRGYLMAAGFSAVGVLLYTLWRIQVASQAASYGGFEVGIPLLSQNLRWLTNDAFQFATSPVLAFILIGSLAFMGMRMVRLVRRYGVSLDVECLFFSMGMTLSFFVILMISWLPSLRYFYPLVPLLGWHLARGYLELDRFLFLRPTRKIVLSALTLLFLGWFVLANYYNFLLQFAVQHNARNIEQHLLSAMEQRLREGRPTAICCDSQDPDMELAFSIRTYFEHYLPLYRGEKLGLRILSSVRSDSPVVLASRRPLDRDHWRLVETFNQPRAYFLLNVAERVSAIAQGRQHPYIVQDAGTHSFDYAWYFYESVGDSLVR